MQTDGRVDVRLVCALRTGHTGLVPRIRRITCDAHAGAGRARQGHRGLPKARTVLGPSFEIICWRLADRTRVGHPQKPGVADAFLDYFWKLRWVACAVQRAGKLLVVNAERPRIAWTAGELVHPVAMKCSDRAGRQKTHEKGM